MHFTLASIASAAFFATQIQANGFHIVTRTWELHEINVCEPGDTQCHPNVYTRENTIGAVPSYDYYNCGELTGENYFGRGAYTGAPPFNNHVYRGICGKGSLISYVKDNGNSLEIWEQGSNKYLGKCSKANGGVVSCPTTAAFRGHHSTDAYVCPFEC